MTLFAWVPIVHSLLMMVVLHGGTQERHEEYEQQHRTKLQQEEEAARRAAEFKVWLSSRFLETSAPGLGCPTGCHLLHGLRQMAVFVERPVFHPSTHDGCQEQCMMGARNSA